MKKILPLGLSMLMLLTACGGGSNLKKGDIINAKMLNYNTVFMKQSEQIIQQT